MPEAEDVLVGAARHATSFAIDLWRRNRVPDAAPQGAMRLRDVRERLEILVEALCGSMPRIRPASAPPPAPLLKRLWRSETQRTHAIAVAGTDGAALYLPPCVTARTPEEALELYRLLALEQAMRLRRGSAFLFPWQEPAPVQDAYLVAEAAAADRDLAAACPGFRAMLGRVKGFLLEQRGESVSLPPAAAALETLYGSLLASNYAGPLCASPAESLRWARSMAAPAIAAGTRARIARDVFLGEVLKPDAIAASAAAAPATEGEGGTPRTARMTRRPRVRAARDDEDDEQTGVWMVQTTEPSEHAEDPMGLQRPADQEPDADLQGAADSLSDLEELRLVRTPGTPRELLLTEDDERGASAAAPPRSHAAIGLRYPEWDYRAGGYRENAVCVHLHTGTAGSLRWVDAALARHRAALLRVRRRFDALKARRAVLRAQPEGDDLDIDAYTNAYCDRLAKLPRTDRYYLAQRPARRDFALLILVDASASTDAWAGEDSRIVDLEKEALLVAATALQALGIAFAVQAFSGSSAADVRIRQVKAFGEPFDRTRAARIAALEPDEYTRVGAAIRHATATLMAQPAERRLLLLLSDAKPNDCDQYEGRYGIEDTRQALAEARLHGIAPFCVTVARDATRHLPRLIGPGNFTVLREPSSLTRALLEWLRAVAIALQ
jgi:nitric oxide reductase NorD protein